MPQKSQLVQILEGSVSNSQRNEYAKNEAIGLLKFILDDHKDIVISSGDDCWYVNGEETSHAQLYAIYQRNKRK